MKELWKNLFILLMCLSCFISLSFSEEPPDEFQTFSDDLDRTLTIESSTDSTTTTTPFRSRALIRLFQDLNYILNLENSAKEKVKSLVDEKEEIEVVLKDETSTTKNKRSRKSTTFEATTELPSTSSSDGDECKSSVTENLSSENVKFEAISSSEHQKENRKRKNSRKSHKKQLKTLTESTEEALKTFTTQLSSSRSSIRKSYEEKSSTATTRCFASTEEEIISSILSPEDYSTRNSKASDVGTTIPFVDTTAIRKHGRMKCHPVERVKCRPVDPPKEENFNNEVEIVVIFNEEEKNEKPLMPLEALRIDEKLIEQKNLKEVKRPEHKSRRFKNYRKSLRKLKENFESSQKEVFDESAEKSEKSRSESSEDLSQVDASIEHSDKISRDENSHDDENNEEVEEIISSFEAAKYEEKEKTIIVEENFKNSEEISETVAESIEIKQEETMLDLEISKSESEEISRLDPTFETTEEIFKEIELEDEEKKITMSSNASSEENDKGTHDNLKVVEKIESSETFVEEVFEKNAEEEIISEASQVHDEKVESIEIVEEEIFEKISESESSERNSRENIQRVGERIDDNENIQSSEIVSEHRIIEIDEDQQEENVQKSNNAKTTKIFRYGKRRHRKGSRKASKSSSTVENHKTDSMDNKENFQRESNERSEISHTRSESSNDESSQDNQIEVESRRESSNESDEIFVEDVDDALSFLNNHKEETKADEIFEETPSSEANEEGEIEKEIFETSSRKIHSSEESINIETIKIDEDDIETVSRSESLQLDDEEEENETFNNIEEKVFEETFDGFEKFESSESDFESKEETLKIEETFDQLEKIEVSSEETTKDATSSIAPDEVKEEEEERIKDDENQEKPLKGIRFRKRSKHHRKSSRTSFKSRSTPDSHDENFKDESKEDVKVEESSEMAETKHERKSSKKSETSRSEKFESSSESFETNKRARPECSESDTMNTSEEFETFDEILEGREKSEDEEEIVKDFFSTVLTNERYQSSDENNDKFEVSKSIESEMEQGSERTFVKHLDKENKFERLFEDLGTQENVKTFKETSTVFEEIFENFGNFRSGESSIQIHGTSDNKLSEESFEGIQKSFETETFTELPSVETTSETTCESSTTSSTLETSSTEKILTTTVTDEIKETFSSPDDVINESTSTVTALASIEESPFASTSQMIKKSKASKFYESKSKSIKYDDDSIYSEKYESSTKEEIVENAEKSSSNVENFKFAIDDRIKSEKVKSEKSEYERNRKMKHELKGVDSRFDSSSDNVEAFRKIDSYVRHEESIKEYQDQKEEEGEEFENEEASFEEIEAEDRASEAFEGIEDASTFDDHLEDETKSEDNPLTNVAEDSNNNDDSSLSTIEIPSPSDLLPEPLQLQGSLDIETTYEVSTKSSEKESSEEAEDPQNLDEILDEEILRITSLDIETMDCSSLDSSLLDINNVLESTQTAIDEKAEEAQATKYLSFDFTFKALQYAEHLIDFEEFEIYRNSASDFSSIANSINEKVERMKNEIEVVKKVSEKVQMKILTECKRRRKSEE